MKFSTTVDNLFTGLSNVKTFVPSNPQQLAFSGICLKVSGSTLNIMATDGDSYTISDIHVNGNEDGVVVVPFKNFNTFVASLPSKTLLEIMMENEDLVVKHNSNEYKFRTLKTNFPMFELTRAEGTSFSYPDLSKAASIVKVSVSKESRDNIVCQVTGNKDSIRLHSTDNYRLSEVVMPGNFESEFKVVVLNNILEKAAKHNLSNLREDKSSKSIVFESPDQVISTRIRNTQFPLVENVIKSVPVNFISFEPKQLEGALDRLSSIAENSPLLISIQGDEMNIKVSNNEIGSGSEMVIIDNPDKFKFDFSIRLTYLQDSVTNCDAAKVKLHFTSAESPVFIIWNTNLFVTHVIMPIAR